MELRRGERRGRPGTPGSPEAVRICPKCPASRRSQGRVQASPGPPVSPRTLPNTEGRVPNTHLPPVKPQESCAHSLAQTAPSLAGIFCCVIPLSFRGPDGALSSLPTLFLLAFSYSLFVQEPSGSFQFRFQGEWFHK